MDRQEPTLREARRPVVPLWLQQAAALGWRALVIAGAIVALLFLLDLMRVVVVPIAFALFFTALLYPAAGWLKARGLAPALAAGSVVALVIAAIAGIVALAGVGIADQSEELVDAVRRGWDDVSAWISRTFPVSLEDVRSVVEGAGSGGGGLSASLVGGAVTAAEIIVGSLLTFVMLFFFLKDGPAMFDWTIERVGEARRSSARELGVVMWTQVAAFARGQAIIAAVDAAATAVALLIIGVPLVIPLTLLTLVGGFIPLVGPIVAGVVAGLVALADGGFTEAVWVVLAALVIQQAEGNLLEPIILGRVLHLHPLVVLVAVVTGGVIGGIAGAFVAAPITAAIVAAISFLRRRSDDAAGQPVPA
jgi:predicted PurR-regulated permease PerM